MMKQSVSVLYVGAAEKGRLLHQLACDRGWVVYQPAEVMEALALHITEFPDIVVLDRRETPVFCAEVEAHLMSLNDGTPMLDGTAYDVGTLLSAIEATFETRTTDFYGNG